MTEAATGGFRPAWAIPPLLLALGLAGWWLWPGPVDLPAGPPPAPAASEHVPPTEPRLRLSDSLSQVPPSPPATAESAQAASPGPAPGLTVVPGPAPAGGPPAPVIPPPRVRLDTRLPDPPKARLSKEMKAPTPREQAEDLWRQADRLLERGQAREAQARLASALALDPNLSPARQSLIVQLLDSGEAGRAEALLREGQARHPDEAWYARARAQLLVQRGDNAQAAALLKPHLGTSTEAADWALYAAAQAQAGQAGEAIRGYQEALGRQPGQGNWWLGLAVAREQAGQRAEAAAAYQRASQSSLAAEVRRYAADKAVELGEGKSPTLR